MLTKMWYMLCDRCGWLDVHGDTGTDVRRLAKQAGWTRRFVDGEPRLQDYCPKCTAVVEES